MTANITWSISQLERQPSDDLVTVSHWRVTAVEDGCTAEVYGFTSHERADEFIPFEQLTEAEVIEWTKAKLDVSMIEADLQNRIDLQKTPTVLTGLPWGEQQAQE